MKFHIDLIRVDHSFEKIACELLRNYIIKIDDKEFFLTEIEFYYFNNNHADYSTHKHNIPPAHWRCHSQGLDISLGFDKEWDGGILLRGISSNGEYINGPRRVLFKIFELFGSVLITEHRFGLVYKKNAFSGSIKKCFRHGLGKSAAGFTDKHYRFYHSVDNWKHLSKKDRNFIQASSLELTGKF